MKRLNLFLAGFFSILVLLVIGCARNAFSVHVEDPTQRIAFKGFSILPPQGKDWYWNTTSNPMVFTRRDAEWGKGTDRRYFFVNQSQDIKNRAIQAGETLHVGVSIIDLEETSFDNSEIYVKFVKLGHTYRPNHPRFKDAESSYILENMFGATCVKFDAKTEDRGVPNRPNSVYIQHDWGWSCINPTNHHQSIMVFASQRFPDGETPLNFQDEINPFLSSLQFN